MMKLREEFQRNNRELHEKSERRLQELRDDLELRRKVLLFCFKGDHVAYFINEIYLIDPEK